MKRLASVITIIYIFMLGTPITLALLDQQVPQDILVDQFYLEEGESHRFGAYDSYITLDKINTYSPDNIQLRYTFVSNDALVLKSLGSGNYTGYLRATESPDRIGGFQIDVNELNSTAAHFVITKDFHLINKEQCNNGVFEASDFVTSNCINCPDLRGDCSLDYANVNYPLELKEIRVEELISNDKADIYSRTDKTYVKIKNEGDSVVNLKDIKPGIFSLFFIYGIDYNEKVFDKLSFAPEEEYSFYYEHPKMYSFLPYECGKEVLAGLAYMPSLYVYGSYGGEVFAFNKVRVECVFTYNVPVSEPAQPNEPKPALERNETFVFYTNEKLLSEMDKLYVESKST